MPILKDEYGSMLKCLKAEKSLEGFELIDLLRQSEGQGRFNPCTYPDNHVLSKVLKYPRMLCDEGEVTKSLDYIFLIKPIDTKSGV